MDLMRRGCCKYTYLRLVTLFLCHLSLTQVLPQGVDWLRTAVNEIDADSSSVRTADGRKLSYEYLVVATGNNFMAS
jgi:NADH dehydrogenase FAD-containing subunit